MSYRTTSAALRNATAAADKAESRANTASHDFVARWSNLPSVITSGESARVQELLSDVVEYARLDKVGQIDGAVSSAWKFWLPLSEDLFEVMCSEIQFLIDAWGEVADFMEDVALMQEEDEDSSPY